MKKKSIVFIIVLVLCGCIASWLVSLDEESESSSQVEEPVQTIEVSPIESETSPEEQPEETEFPMEEVTAAQMKEFTEAAEKAMDSLKETFVAVDKGSAKNIVIDENGVAQLVSVLGQSGYSAIDYYGHLNMQNPQPLIDLGNAVNAGNAAQACYYVVHSDGSIHANNLIYKNGLASVVTVSVDWGDNAKPRVYSSGQYPLAELSYSPKGWLIVTRAGDNGLTWASNGNSYTFVRLTAYDSTKRQMAEKYMGEHAYSENNLFTCSWSGSDFSALDINSIFLPLYSRYYGTAPLTGDSIKRIAGFQNVEDSDLFIVPYSQFEQVISHFLEMNGDTIKWLGDDSEKYGGYFILGSRQEYYNEIIPSIPKPDVVDYWYNSDGSLTMKVEAVYPAHSTDCAFTHELTVMETANGFYYVSNKLYDSQGNIVPEMVLRSERKNRIAALD